MSDVLQLEATPDALIAREAAAGTRSRQERLDRLVRLACRLFEAPIALISVLDPAGEQIVASVGLLAAEIADGTALGASFVEDEQALVVADAQADERFVAQPLVAEGPRIRFFAAHRLAGPGGEPLGSFCILDRRRRELNPGELEALADLASIIQAEIHAAAVQRALVRQSVGLARAQTVIELTADGVLLCDESGTILACNGAVEQIFGYVTAELTGNNIDFLVPAVYRGDAPRAEGAATPAARVLVAGERETIGRRRSGEALLVRVALRALPGEAQGRWLVLTHDLTEGRRLDAQRRRRLTPGSLRDLPDRAFFRSRLDQALAADRATASGVAVLLLELDYFDQAVQKLGRPAADMLLLEVYRRLRASLRPDDTAAFMGGSAFAVLFERLGVARDALRPAERVLGQLRTPLTHGRSELIAAPNIGIALSSLCLREDGIPDLVMEADLALRQARAMGRWRLQIMDAHEHAPGGAILPGVRAIAPALPAALIAGGEPAAAASEQAATAGEAETDPEAQESATTAASDGQSDAAMANELQAAATAAAEAEPAVEAEPAAAVVTSAADDEQPAEQANQSAA